jgi:hypothetical protein
MATRVRVKSGTEIRMTKTRQDGTQVDLGVVSATYTNPLRQWWWKLVGKPRADARIRAENKRSEP